MRRFYHPTPSALHRLTICVLAALFILGSINAYYTMSRESLSIKEEAAIVSLSLSDGSFDTPRHKIPVPIKFVETIPLPIELSYYRGSSEPVLTVAVNKYPRWTKSTFT